MDKNRDYSKEFILADFPFKASRTIQQMVQLRQKFPNVSGSSKQNVEQKNFQRGVRRTMSTFKIPQSMYIDTDDFYLKPEEIRTQLSLSSNKSAFDFKSQRTDLNRTKKYRDTNQQMYASQQIFKDITIQMTDPVYKLNKEKLKEMNKQGIQKAELQLQQQQLQMLKQQNQDASIQQIGKIGINESKLQLSEQKGKLESSKLMSQSKKTIPTEFLNDSIGNQNNSISVIQNQEFYSNIPQQIQSKHQIQNLLHQIEQNNKQLNEYQLNQSQHLIPSQEDIKFDQDQSIMVKKNPIFKSKKFFGRKSSCNSINLSKQKDTTFQMNQTVINQTQIPANQIFVDESSMIGKKTDNLVDNTMINPILSFQTELDMRPSNPIAGSSIGYLDQREGDTTMNNNPFLQDEDLSILVNQTGDELLIIKIPNLQNYKIQPLELFDSYLNQDPDPLQLIKESSIRAYSRWVKPDGESVWKDCQVIKYNPTTKRFLIKWISNDRMKEVTRLNLMYEWENEEMMNKRNKEALKKREQLLYYMGMKIFVNEEKGQDKSIYYSKQTLLNVIDKVFNSKNSRKLKRMNYKRVVEEILEMFKYEVIKFACEINTVPSLDHFFEAYFPELKQSLKKKQNLLYDVVMNCQNYPERLLEEQKVQNKKKTDQSTLIKHKTFQSLHLENQKEHDEYLPLENDNQNQTQNIIKEQYKNLKKSKLHKTLQSNSQKNILNSTQHDDQSIDKTNQDEQQNSHKKKSAFFQNIQGHQEKQTNLEVLNESDQKKQLENDTNQNLEKTNQNEENNDQFKINLENKRNSSLFIQSNKFTFFKSANITQPGSINGISQINFKRSQYLLSPDTNEFISLRQTQQEEMSQIDSILSQVKFNDYEFLTEEVYTFNIKRQLEVQEKELQTPKQDDHNVFKYTQSEKLNQKDKENKLNLEKAQIFFQHYAIPHPYFPFLKEKLLQNFYFSNEYHNTVFKRIVPNVSLSKSSFNDLFLSFLI